MSSTFQKSADSNSKKNEQKLLTNPIKVNKINEINKEYNNISIDTEIDIIKNNREKIKGLPINIHTREMDSLKQLGVLYKYDINDDNIKPGNNDKSVVLPLYGRSKYRGSTKWIYYTTTDSNNSIRIPIYHKNKQCDKEIGCNELYSDDIINIPALNGNFKVHINEPEELRYIPY